MSKEDTTDNGVSEEAKTAEDYAKEQGPLDRDQDFNDIVQNAKISRQLEAAGVDMKNPMEVNLAMEKLARGEDPNPNAGKPDPEEEAAALAAYEGGDPDLEGQDELGDKPEMVTVKINGVEKLERKSVVDAEGGIKAYQKLRAAEEKMQEAARKQKDIDERERRLAERELAISQQQGASLKEENTARPSHDAESIAEMAKELTAKMYSGNEEDAQAAIQTILERTQNSSTPLDSDTIVNQAAAMVQWQNELRQAQNNFKTEFKDIYGNPEYRKYADQATLRIKDEHPEWGPQEILKEAGEQARLKFRDQLRESGADPEKDKARAEEEARLAAKRATDNVNRADTRVQSKPEKKPLTPSQIVANMQQNRSHSPA